MVARKGSMIYPVLACCRNHFKQRMRLVVLIVTGLLMIAFTIGFWISYNLTRYQMQVVRETYEKQLQQAVDYLARKKK